jgi:hypothetical protein
MSTLGKDNAEITGLEPQLSNKENGMSTPNNVNAPDTIEALDYVDLRNRPCIGNLKSWKSWEQFIADLGYNNKIDNVKFIDHNKLAGNGWNSPCHEYILQFDDFPGAYYIFYQWKRNGAGRAEWAFYTDSKGYRVEKKKKTIEAWSRPSS